MTHCDSVKIFLRLFLSLTVLFLHCPSDSAAALTPIKPGVLNFDLKIGDKVVGKIEGDVKFTVFINTTGNSTAVFRLMRADFVVNGTQTSDKTVFNIYGKDSRFYNNVEWSLTFEKSSKGEVKLTESTLQFNSKGWDPNGGNITVDWTKAVQMVNTSSNAYKCSSIRMSNDHGNFVITDAKIQPFDLKDEKFGQDVLCSQDQPAQPVAGDWNVTQIDTAAGSTKEYTCIKLTSFVYLMINYTMNNQTNATAVVLVPSNASTDGSTCSFDFGANQVIGDKQILQLNFVPIGQISSQIWNLKFMFTNNSVLSGKGNIDAYQANLDFFYDPAIFLNVENSLKNTNGKVFNSVNMTSGEGALNMFTTASDHSYRCNANETTKVTSEFWIKTESLRVEAFLPNSTTLLTEHVCTLDQNQETSDLIPIIIGAALAALVVIVLVAYLIGRAKARGSNYETI